MQTASFFSESLGFTQNSQLSRVDIQLFIRRYLQEIGYTDKVVELRSARVKMMLGLTSEDANAQTHEQLDMKLPPQQGKPIINSTNEQRLKGGYMEDETEIAAEVAKTGKPGAK